MASHHPARALVVVSVVMLAGGGALIADAAGYSAVIGVPTTRLALGFIALGFVIGGVAYGRQGNTEVAGSYLAAAIGIFIAATITGILRVVGIGITVLAGIVLVWNAVRAILENRE